MPVPINTSSRFHFPTFIFDTLVKRNLQRKEVRDTYNNEKKLTSYNFYTNFEQFQIPFPSILFQHPDEVHNSYTNSGQHQFQIPFPSVHFRHPGKTKPTKEKKLETNNNDNNRDKKEKNWLVHNFCTSFGQHHQFQIPFPGAHFQHSDEAKPAKGKKLETNNGQKKINAFLTSDPGWLRFKDLMSMLFL